MMSHLICVFEKVTFKSVLPSLNWQHILIYYIIYINTTLFRLEIEFLLTIYNCKQVIVYKTPQLTHLLINTT